MLFLFGTEGGGDGPGGERRGSSRAQQGRTLRHGEGLGLRPAEAKAWPEGVRQAKRPHPIDSGFFRGQCLGLAHRAHQFFHRGPAH